MSYQEKGNAKIIKKKPYAPIMLTSKSIKPVSKSDAKEKSVEQSSDKFLQRKNMNKQQINSYLMFTKQLQKRRKKVIISDQLLYTTRYNRLALKYPDNAMENKQQEYLQVKMPVSTSIVKMEFTNNDRSIRKNNSRYHQYKTKSQFIYEQVSQIRSEYEYPKFAGMYCTNIKTFDQLQKYGKISKNYDVTSNAFREKVYQKKIAKINKLKYQEQWNKYLNKYYLKIKQVTPVSKMSATMRQSSTELNQKNQQSINMLQSKDNHLQRARSNTVMTQVNRLRKAKSQIQVANIDYAKIQSDVLSKKVNISKKDFFVFGTSDAQVKTQNINKLRFQYYKDFLWKINFSNSIYVKLNQQIEVPYKLYVGKGNNSLLIKGIMRRRFWWQIVQKLSDQPNFVWTQLKISEFHSSQKTKNYKNPQYFFDQKKNAQKIQQLDNEAMQLQIFNKKILCGKDFQIWANNYRINKLHQDKMSESIYQRRLKTMIKKKYVRFVDQTALQKMNNHFQCNYFLGNKKALFYSLKKYYTLQNLNPFQYIPLTFHIADGLQDPQFQAFLKQFERLSQERLANKQLKNIWIMKPGENSNRGRGITVCATLDQIKVRLKNKEKNSDGSSRTYILQRYIQKPLLYNRRKFDIRHYMLMTCVNGQMKGYWYSQGYIRTTSSQYNIKNCKDLYTHLTNDAIQKNSVDYGKYQKGNKLSYQDFQKYLTKNVSKNIDFFEQILPTMKKLANDSVCATYSYLQPHRKQNNFQLFGLDFMIDEQMKVYLIEVNTNPCLQTSCPLLGKIITGLIDNVFKICVDPLFPPPFEFPSSKKFQLGQNSLAQNKFQLFFDQNFDGIELKSIYQREPNMDCKMGIVQEQNQLYQDQGEWKQDQPN